MIAGIAVEKYPRNFRSYNKNLEKVRKKNRESIPDSAEKNRVKKDKGQYF